MERPCTSRGMKRWQLRGYRSGTRPEGSDRRSLHQRLFATACLRDTSKAMSYRCIRTIAAVGIRVVWVWVRVRARGWVRVWNWRPVWIPGWVPVWVPQPHPVASHRHCHPSQRRPTRPGRFFRNPVLRREPQNKRNPTIGYALWSKHPAAQPGKTSPIRNGDVANSAHSHLHHRRR